MLTEQERQLLAVLADRVFPPDGDSVGAVGLGAVTYIERLLVGDLALAERYHSGLKQVATPGGDAPADFFRLVATHVKEGIFGDPRHGGNRNGEGWRLIGHPGPPPFTPPPAPVHLSGAVAEYSTETEVCLIGLGAAGAIVAHVLAAAGHTVVALEAGPAEVDKSLCFDELSIMRNVVGPKFMSELPVVGGGEAGMLGPDQLAGNTMTNGAGGSSVHYAAHAWRFGPEDFAPLTSTLANFDTGLIPPDAMLEDWPLHYDDLEQYYEKVEFALGIAGEAGVLGDPARTETWFRTGRGNRFEGARRAEYPLPPLCSDSALSRSALQAGRQLGLNPFPGPSAILSKPYRGRQACTYCGWCNAFPCHTEAKSSTRVTVIPEALQTGRLHLYSGCRVVRLDDDGRNRVRQVVYLDPNGTVRTLSARVFVLAAFTFENVRLLLLSRSNRFPQGLANRHNQVGVGYMSRPYPRVKGYFPDRAMNRFEGPHAQRVVVNDWNSGTGPHRDAPFIRGGHFYFAHQLTPISGALELPPGVPEWGAGYRRFITTQFGHVVSATIQAEVLPYRGNRLALSGSRVDPLGLPVLDITFRVGENEERLFRFLQEQASRVLLQMGAQQVWAVPAKGSGISGHDVGGTRMGGDPSTSVVDGFGQTHELDNLFIVGGSVFPSLPGYQPSLTMQALAWRTAEAIIARCLHD
jgi:gluconate 2-dehydrogenase alpha chain